MSIPKITPSQIDEDENEIRFIFNRDKFIDFGNGLAIFRCPFRLFIHGYIRMVRTKTSTNKNEGLRVVKCQLLNKYQDSARATCTDMYIMVNDYITSPEENHIAVVDIVNNVKFMLSPFSGSFMIKQPKNGFGLWFHDESKPILKDKENGIRLYSHVTKIDIKIDSFGDMPFHFIDEHPHIILGKLDYTEGPQYIDALTEDIYAKTEKTNIEIKRDR